MIQGPQIHLPQNHMFFAFSSYAFEHINVRLVKKHLFIISYSPHCLANIISENNKKTTTRLTIHQSFQKPPKTLITCPKSPPKKKKIELPGPPQLSPRMLPKAPGTPQDPADPQGNPQDLSGTPRGRPQDLPRTPPRHSSIPAKPPGTMPRASRTQLKPFQDT